MQINFNGFESKSYSEISQSNPLRWMNLKPNEDGTYTAVSGWWKCKDFMNDALTAYHTGKTFSIYGFTVDPKHFYAPGQTTMPILLKNVAAGWVENMCVVNDYLEEQGMPPVAFLVDNEHTFVELPNKYLENTFYMSQVTLFIRLANTEKVYQCLQEMQEDPVNCNDADNLAACMEKPIGQLADKLKQYLWYYDVTNNCTKTTERIMTSMMHDCGVVSWGWV